MVLFIGLVRFVGSSFVPNFDTPFLDLDPSIQGLEISLLFNARIP